MEKDKEPTKAGYLVNRLPDWQLDKEARVEEGEMDDELDHPEDNTW